MDPTQATSYRLDSPLFRLQPKRTLAELIKEDPSIYFFLEGEFPYQVEVFKYFDGEDTLALTDGKEFLTVLGAVLVKTEYVQCNDSWSEEEDIEWIVRERFLELYRENHEMLAQIESPVHEQMTSSETSEEDFFDFIDLASQVLNFINGDHPQDIVAKYYDRLKGKITEEESEEFMRVYDKVKRSCPLVPLSDSPSDSRRSMVRRRFDELYFAQERELIGWGKVFFTPNSFLDSPYKGGERSRLRDVSPTGFPRINFELIEEEPPLTFAELEGEEEYNFAAVGLSREQIIGFYDGTMATKEGLFEVLHAVFSCYLNDTPRDSFEGKLRDRFLKLYLTECAEQSCVLTPSQKEELWGLTKKSSSGGSHLEVTPRHPIRYGSKVPSRGSGGGVPPWEKGLAGIGVIILSWVIFKPIFCKLISFIKEKYGTRTNHPS